MKTVLLASNTGSGSSPIDGFRPAQAPHLDSAYSPSQPSLLGPQQSDLAEGSVPVTQESPEVAWCPTPRAYVNGCEAQPRAPLSLRILAGLGIVAGVVLAQAILLPIVVGFLLAITLRPFVRRGRKYGIPDSLSAVLMLSALVTAALFSVTRVIDPARHWIDAAPSQLKTIEAKLSTLRSQFAAIFNTSAAVNDLAAAATGADTEVIQVQVHDSLIGRHISIATSTGNVLGTTLVVLVLAFFVLTSGDRLLAQILSGLPRMSEKKRTVELVHEIERGIATYLTTVTAINAGLALASGIGLWFLGLPNPALWGVMIFLFNYVPFVGPIVCSVILIAVSLLSFDSLAYACVPPLVFIAISAVEGNLLTPLILGRSMSLNPIIVFVALIAGGWAWGLGGVILAVPLLAITKIASDKFQSTQMLAKLLAG